MRLTVVFCVASLAAFSLLKAQTPAPKPVVETKPAPRKVDAALRARVTEFYQNQMAGNFQKSYELVAKESRDYYLSASKDKSTVFKIDEIQYRDKFSRALVRIATTNRILVGTRALELPTFAVSYWKQEGGKWVWYHDPEADQPNFFGVPLGESGKPGDNLARAVPHDTSPQAAASAAEAALKGAADKPILDTESLEFVLGVPATRDIVVRNPYTGPVHLVTSIPGQYEGVTVEPREIEIAALGETSVKVRYLALYRDPAATAVAFQLQPFPKTYTVPVRIAARAESSVEQPKP